MLGIMKNTRHCSVAVQVGHMSMIYYRGLNFWGEHDGYFVHIYYFIFSLIISPSWQSSNFGTMVFFFFSMIKVRSV